MNTRVENIKDNAAKRGYYVVEEGGKKYIYIYEEEENDYEQSNELWCYIIRVNE